MTTFSVIIPTYNRKAFLLECLETVLNQSLEPHEVIVVDDGSNDGTAEELEVYGERVRLLKQSNAGPGAARNLGARHASGEYLAFLDSDDLWFPWTLSTFADLIKQHGKPSLLFGRYIDFQQRAELATVKRSTPTGDAYEAYLASHAKGYFAGAGMMVVDREAFKLSSGFPEDFLNAEDHDLALQLGIARGFVQALSPTTVGHRVHEESEMRDVWKTIEGLCRLVRKERAGEYPGGSIGRLRRRDIIARHARSAVLGSVGSNRSKEAWALYRGTFGWNLRLGRFRYLLGAPIWATISRLRLGK